MALTDVNTFESLAFVWQLFAVVNNAGYNLGGAMECLERKDLHKQFDGIGCCDQAKFST
jgi:hypothetical protein